MVNSIEQERGSTYVQYQRFFPALENLIDESDRTYVRKHAQKAFIKAYLLCATGGSAYFSCASCGFHSQLINAAIKLGTTPATVGLAFEARNLEGKLHGVRFLPEVGKEIERGAYAKLRGLSEITRVRISCRAGIGLLDLFEISRDLRDKIALEKYLSDYVESQIEQTAALIKLLDKHLEATNNGTALAAERVRTHEKAEKAGEFGKLVWAEAAKLYAAGHARESL